MCYKSLVKWWCHLHYRQNNSKRQLELTANLMQTFENLLLQSDQQNYKIFYPNSPRICLLNSKDGQNSKLS